MEHIKNNSAIKFLKIFLIIVLGTVVLAISSKIKIPFYPVPMTMQTFVVLLIGISFGWKISIATVGLYLIEGILGLPVFSGTPEKGLGITYFFGPTMGYLLGFIFAAFLSGNFNYDNSKLVDYIVNFFKLIFSVSTIYVLGLLWLGFLIGWDKPIFELGAKPFLLAEVFKILILTLVCAKAKKLRKFI